MDIVSLHLGALILTALVVLYADHRGMGYVRGTQEMLSPQFITWSHRLVATGLGVLVATGLMLAIPERGYFFTEPVFYLKMGFVLALIINGFWIGRLSSVTTMLPFRALPQETKRKIFVSGAISLVSWIGAATIGLFYL